MVSNDLESVISTVSQNGQNVLRKSASTLCLMFSDVDYLPIFVRTIQCEKSFLSVEMVIIVCKLENIPNDSKISKDSEGLSKERPFWFCSRTDLLFNIKTLGVEIIQPTLVFFDERN